MKLCTALLNFGQVLTILINRERGMREHSGKMSASESPLMTIKIGIMPWQVRRVPEAEIDCDEHTIGDQSESTQVIRIASNLSDLMAEEVFLHEVLHCINPQLDHSLVEMIAKSLHQFLKDNDLMNQEQLNNILNERIPASIL